MSEEHARVAVIGTGAMGGRIAARLLGCGADVVVWNRSHQKLDPLVALGAEPMATPGEATQRAKVVITMVADPGALWAVTDGSDGIAAAAVAGQTLIDMSTVGPAAVRELAARLPPGVELLDAPVLGSVSEAESGSLAIFVGGDRGAFKRSRKLLELLGSPSHVGGLGCGAAAKLVANYTLFGVLGVLGEALALADQLELKRDATFSVLAATPLAAQADKRRRALASGEYPLRFPLSLAHKDAHLVVEAARDAGLELAIAEALRRSFAAADEAGWGGRDYSALLPWLLSEARARDAADCQLRPPAS